MAHPGGFSEPFNREFEPIEFHNSEPRSREERLAAQSREKLEKTLLKVRERELRRDNCFGPLLFTQ